MNKKQRALASVVQHLDMKETLTTQQKKLTELQGALTTIVATTAEEENIPTYVTKSGKLYNTQTQEVTKYVECKKNMQRPLTRAEKRVLMEYRVQKIVEMRLEGKKWSEIAKYFGYRQGTTKMKAHTTMMYYRKTAKTLGLPLVQAPKQSAAKADEPQMPVAPTRQGRTVFSTKKMGRKGRNNA